MAREGSVLLLGIGGRGRFAGFLLHLGRNGVGGVGDSAGSVGLAFFVRGLDRVGGGVNGG